MPQTRSLRKPRQTGDLRAPLVPCQRRHHPYRLSLGPPSSRHLLALHSRHSRHSRARPFAVSMSCSIVRIPFVLYETSCLEFKYSATANQRRGLYLWSATSSDGKGSNQYPQSPYGESTLVTFHNLDADVSLTKAAPLVTAGVPTPTSAMRLPQAFSWSRHGNPGQNGIMDPPDFDRGSAPRYQPTMQSIYSDLRRPTIRRFRRSSRAQTALSSKSSSLLLVPCFRSFAS
jgi:hypothetical protein